MRKRLAIILILLITLLVIVAFVETIPPRGMTITRMTGLKIRILRYAHSHGELPPSLVGLPILEGKDESSKDGWGRDIRYEVVSPDLVVLTSLGRDGLAGGNGDDSDVIRMFPSRDAHGQWNDENTIDWTGNPEGK